MQNIKIKNEIKKCTDENIRTRKGLKQPYNQKGNSVKKKYAINYIIGKLVVCLQGLWTRTVFIQPTGSYVAVGSHG
jgi:hypothetical protein